MLRRSAAVKQKSPQTPRKRSTMKYLLCIFVVIGTGYMLVVITMMVAMERKQISDIDEDATTNMHYPQDLYLDISSPRNTMNLWQHSLRTLEMRTISPNYNRIVAIGDLHGDFDQTIRILQMADIIDPVTSECKSRDTILIQTGDIVDRGPASIEIYELFIKLRDECAPLNTLVLNQLGNHEHLNIIQNFMYVHPQELRKRGGIHGWKTLVSGKSRIGHFIRNLPAARIVGNSLFVHAGILPGVAKHFDSNILTLNERFHALIMNISDTIKPLLFYASLSEENLLLFGNDSPVWTRYFSPLYYDLSMQFKVNMHAAQHQLNRKQNLVHQQKIELYMCALVNEVVQLYNVSRIVTGHNPNMNGEIATYCDGKLYGIDVGMSQFYGGNLGAIEIDIKSDNVSIIN